MNHDAFVAETERNRTLLKEMYCNKGRHFWQAYEHIATGEEVEPKCYYWAAYVCNVCQEKCGVALNGPLLTPDGVPYQGNPIIDWITDEQDRIIEVRDGATGEHLWPLA